MFTKIRNIAGLVGGVIVSLWLYFFAHNQGRKKGQKETLKAVNKAEEQRRETQDKIDNRQQAAIDDAMGVTSDNVVDRFNSMFERSDDKIKS